MMPTIRALAFGFLCLALAVPSVPAQTSYPMISHVTPVAVQRGKTTEVTVEGQMEFAGVYKVLCEGVGISFEVLPAPPPASPKGASPKKPLGLTKLKLTVAADAELGVREFRVASNLGLSSLGQIVIVDHPVVLETEGNNTPDKANPLTIPGSVCGKITPEDVDYFKFRAETGQTVTFEVNCARLQDKIHDLQKHADPILTLHDAEGRELAGNDDFYFADPMLSYKFAKSGDYYLQVRDAKYMGDGRWVYALHATFGPYVSHVYPMAGNPGQKLEVEPIGAARVLQPRVALSVPTEVGLRRMQFNFNGVQSTPTAFVVSPLPQVLEAEPNDTPEQATRVTLPCGINGRIGVRRDLDHFRFTAAKDKAIRFEVKARRFGTILQSSLDSIIDILSPKGDVLASNDDAYGKDASLVFTPKADGEYVLRIRDLNSKGGETYVYYIEADWARPDFALRCDPDKAMIGPGSSTAWYVHVVRANGFNGPVSVEVKGLPKGVSASPLSIPPSMTQGVVVLTAAPNAPRDAANVHLVGTGTVALPDGKMETLVRPVTPNEEIYSPGGGRTIMDVHTQAVAVTDPSDILKVSVNHTAVTLKPGEEVKIDVAIQRRADYDKPVNIDVALIHGRVFANPLPPGVTVEKKSKTALGKGNQGYIILKAAADAAPIEAVPISVLGHVSINFVVKISYSSQPILVTIRK